MGEERSVNPLAMVCFVLCWVHTHGEASTDCSPVGETGSPDLAEDLRTAEHAQRRHLEVLFSKYGENGTISLEGLKRLLESVGLDRIRKVMVQHQEEAGHPGEGHVDGGTHHHTHQHHHHVQHQGHPHWQDLPATKKTAEAPKVQRSEGAPAKKIEDSNAHHNLYDKRVQQEISTTPVYTTNVLLKSQEFRSRRSADYNPSQDSASTSQGDNSTHVDVLGTTTKLIDNLLVSEEQTISPDPQHLDDQDHVGRNSHDHDHDHGHSHNDDHTHNPDTAHEPIPDPSHNQDQDPDHSHDPDNHDHDHSHDHIDHKEECLNASSILSAHGMTKVVLSVSDFSYLCPALLNQMDTKSCILHAEDRLQINTDRDHHSHHGHGHHDHDHDHDNEHDHDHQLNDNNQNGSSIKAAWIGGFVSITIISLLSLLGVVLIPLMNRVFFKFLLSFLVALAVGTLSGDAFLHLIPHSQGGHNHHYHSANVSEGQLHHGDEEDNLDPVWKGLTALSGVYFMFLIEHFLTLGKMYKDKKQKNQKKWGQNEDGVEADKQPVTEENDNLKPSEDVETNGAGVFKDQSTFTSELARQGPAEEEEVMLAPAAASAGYEGYMAQDCENKCHSHFHDTVGQPDDLHHHHHDYHHILHHHHSQNHHPHSHSHSYSQQHFQEAGVATLAWMVIMGDGLHNFSDGLAIGAAFTEGLSSGLSTSVAVFCHELPHELGDFAVLLKAGMTVKQAILYNVLSAMMAYLGMITGILIGHYAENIAMWIFALTAGLFMYVALVDMVPEMLHNDAGDQGFSHCGYFLLQNAGILMGFGIMLLIAIFEHKIQLDIGL
ncbi:zinc transporter ZIP6 isoform X2 [Conger conger]|nr:zinc transporter ZIP6 isoform X2 [Conger conger]XP_061112106.1 zinc transporter ZIP6 isoform X2 [Conger conger]XP_061112107.1 zinc transporter ZIP6 isoform X2 [Conger conger]XP_061112108.1 zinc transporter ZIP6 isoform X2 [Conger conger]XP_061112109.1 zinc transporter ZIP6 isoform X2 [Conger conger]XP_061112110.1 zinc transporter ZIP6 isoform X2 [Conger conger]